MKMRLRLFLCFFPLWAFAGDMSIENINFAYRVPQNYDENSKILVLFGGRNWHGGQTLKSYQFDPVADKHRLFLLSPSFKDQDYWQPEQWSGKLLLKAVAELENRYRLKPQKLYFYGYSAGGQCAALFYNYMPERVEAWGVHACGVYPETLKQVSAPVLITCGQNDTERFQISRNFIYRYREQGGVLLWKPLSGGHELNAEALELARAWFDAILLGVKVAEYGEDDTMQIKKNIDLEFRNPLYSPKIRELWLKATSKNWKTCLKIASRICMRNLARIWLTPG
ncbi:MAG: hypothetical protein LBM70_01115 [Victivallales bacterium]|jgi:predicted esterase|nr:hypothetical protein [Victivallales bacterium]